MSGHWNRREVLGGLIAAAGSQALAQGPPAQQPPVLPQPGRPGGGGPRMPPPKPTRKQVLAWADIRYGQQHDSVTRALVTIEKLGRDTGLFDTWIRTDSQLITKQPVVAAGRPITFKNLDYYDAIFFFGVREIELTDQQKADLLSFVKDDGKGFVAAHTATTAFFSWPEFGEMLGGRFDEHPWGITDATVVIEDPAFPAMKHFKPTQVMKDEHYQTKDFSRDKIRVLASLDPKSVNMDAPNVHHKDGDFPVAWAKNYGKGRVFYSTLGHAAEYWDTPQIQTMYLEAMKWALRLTDGDATPRPRP